MILYITSDDYKMDFDEICTETNMIINKSCIRKQKLNKFIAQELKNMAGLTHLIIDKTVITDTEDEFKDNIEALSIMYNAKILLYIHDKEESENVIYRDGYTVINAAHKNIDDEVKAFLSGKLIENKLENIWIAVAGLNDGAGCTSTAIKLANYIKKYEASVCYVEANESNDLMLLADYYLFDKLDEGHYTYNNLNYRKDKLDMTVRFLVFDLGKLSKKTLAIYDKCTIKILVSDSKPYRLDNVDKVINSLVNGGTLNVLFNFSIQEEQERIRNRCIDVSGVKVYFSEYNTNLFSVSHDEYKDIMKDYINIIDEEPPVKPRKVSKIRIVKKGLAAFLFAFIVCGSITFNVFFINMYKKDKAHGEQSIVLQNPIKVISDFEHLKESMAMEASTTEEAVISTTEDLATNSNDIADANNNSSNIDISKDSSAYVATTQTSTESTTESAEPERTTEASTEVNNNHNIDVTPTISLSGYNGQIYSGSSVKSIISKVAGYGISYSVLLRDDTYTSDTSMIDNSCSYLCQVSGNSLTFIEQ